MTLALAPVFWGWKVRGQGHGVTNCPNQLFCNKLLFRS